jgi:aspartate carbamoyltransferase catalytic subunit
VKFVFVSPKALVMPDWIVRELKGAGKEIKQVEDLGKVIGDMDVICATRIQEERFASAKEAEKYKGVYVINRAMMKKAKKSAKAGAGGGAILLHPLPRVDEIAVEVDNDPRSRYFEQVSNGVALRMALMAEVLGK